MNGIDIAHDMSGPSDGPVVVLGHAFCANRDLWLDQEAALTGAGYRVLHFDARGHGESSVPQGDMRFDDMVGDVVGLMDQLSIERAHYVGISMSGMVGQYLALAHADRLRSLTLVNTTARYDSAQRTAWETRAAAIERDGIGPHHDALMARWFTPASLERDLAGVRLMSRGCRAMSRELFASAARMIGSVNTIDRLGEICLSTLILAGAEDPATPPAMSKVLHQGITGSELVIIDAAAHISPVEQPGAVNAALLDFLNRQSRD